MGATMPTRAIEQDVAPPKDHNAAVMDAAAMLAVVYGTSAGRAMDGETADRAAAQRPVVAARTGPWKRLRGRNDAHGKCVHGEGNANHQTNERGPGRRGSGLMGNPVAQETSLTQQKSNALGGRELPRAVGYQRRTTRFGGKHKRWIFYSIYIDTRTATARVDEAQGVRRRPIALDC